MITRPLDLAAKLRRGPRNLDALFFINVGALALFFTMFGSRFVLAPGLGLDFQMPKLAGAMTGAASTQRVVSVLPSGQIFAADGLLSMAQLREWLKGEAKILKQPSLLVRASAGVPLSELAGIVSVAREAGFVRVVVGAEEAAVEKPGARR